MSLLEWCALFVFACFVLGLVWRDAFDRGRLDMLREIRTAAERFGLEMPPHGGWLPPSRMPNCPPPADARLPAPPYPPPCHARCPRCAP